MTAPVFLVHPARLRGDRIRLDGPEGHHAATVRRIRPGERVDLTDGAGTIAQCVVTAVAGDALDLDVLGRRSVAQPQPTLTVVQALAKGERGELAVAMMTEVGVDVIVPWAAARCVTRWRAERGTRSLARWRSTAREAAKQARRAWLPEVTDLASTADVAGRLRRAALAAVLHEEAEAPLADLPVPARGDVVLVVGPEGGITSDELGRFTSAGARTVRLGPTVLRTSTAGVGALTVLQVRSGRWS